MQALPSERKRRVFIVDDHPLFRERLSQLIGHELDMEVCGEAETAQRAIQLIREASPDLAIVDITLKASSGLELIKSIKALSVSVPILVLSMHDESLYAERALRAGATGYITKNQAADEVLLAVRRVLSGEIYLSEQMTSDFLKSLTGAGVKNMLRPLGRLTNRELEVLDLIGRGYTTRQIAESLDLGVATVDTYRARIKEKMDFRNAVELQHFAIRWVRDRE
jgi:DNA-binding NarL/FixJ family response regulator